MLDVNDQVIEGIMSNLFMVKDRCLITPRLSYSGVAGIMREFLLVQAKQQGMSCEVKDITLLDLEKADEIFMTNSLMPVRVINQLVTPISSIIKPSTEFAQWALNAIVDDIQQQCLESVA